VVLLWQITCQVGHKEYNTLNMNELNSIPLDFQFRQNGNKCIFGTIGVALVTSKPDEWHFASWAGPS
jgi:hypothetical protein